MGKNTSPSFVLSLELEDNPLIFSVIEDELENCRVIYNTILGKYLKLEHQMKREKTYKKLIRQYKAVSGKLEKNPKNEHLKAEKKTIQEKLKQLRKKYQLTEYASHKWVKPIREHFGNKVNAAVAQKTASRAWNTFSGKLFGKAKKVRFIRKGDMDSFEGKTNTTGWRFVDGFVVYKDLHIKLKVKPNDDYVSEIYQKLGERNSFSYRKGKETKNDFYRVKYVRIVKKVIRGKIRCFANLVIAGFPPSKGRKLGKGRVGIDIGTSTVGVSSMTKVAIYNLAEQVKDIAREIKRIQRKMDRSKRAMNPENYNENGTIRKGKKTWVFSNRYEKLRLQLKELHRKQAEIRKLSHRTLTNALLKLGDTFFVETMNFTSLQRRKKKTEISEKTGKYKRKKRFGKTLGSRAPAMFISILKEKVNQYGGTFTKVNTQKFKASQYCHIRKNYFKKPLSERWHIIDSETKFQRDLYSAFLLMNSTKSGTRANQQICEETFPLFQKLHDLEITEIHKQKKMILNSGITVIN